MSVMTGYLINSVAVFVLAAAVYWAAGDE